MWLSGVNKRSSLQIGFWKANTQVPETELTFQKRQLQFQERQFRFQERQFWFQERQFWFQERHFGFRNVAFGFRNVAFDSGTSPADLNLGCLNEQQCESACEAVSHIYTYI